ncbi:MAG: ABC transporter ATP-binding protein [bacterium]|nr:ABC transporter ATP-binding protein [bacterium]
MTTFVTKPDQSPKGTPVDAWATVKRGLSLSPELRRGIALTFLLAGVATAGRIIIPVAIQQILDGGLTEAGADLGFVARMVVLSLVAVGVTAFSTGVMHLRLAVMTEVSLSNLRVRAFRHIHDLSMLHQAAEQRGVLVARVTSDIDQISRFMQWAGLMIIVNGGQALLAMVVMGVYSWQLFLTVMALLPIILYSIRWFQKRLATAYLVVRERVGQLMGALAEAVAGAPVIRAYGIEDRVRADLGEVIERHRAAAVRTGGFTSGFSGVSELLTSTVTAAVLVVGTLLAVGGDTSIGTVVAFLFLVQLMIMPLQLFGEAINEAQSAVAGWQRVLDVLDTPPDVADPGDDGLDLPVGPLEVRFEGVTFRYPKPGENARQATGTTALEGVSVRLDPRSHVAVVGETGSGKTTFAKLATRLMDTSDGVVLLGGIEVSRVRFSSLRHRVVMVPQDGMLFRGSILENVQMGKPGISREGVEQSFFDLGLTEWLAELPKGLDTPVGERGSSLSVGERQLVTLVRAALADPDLLVLDEATSAVDPATEARISNALENLTKGRTVITIAHRLSSAEAAHRILVFDQGRMVQDGPHRQLREEPGVYRHLYQAWEQGALNRASVLP